MSHPVPENRAASNVVSRLRRRLGVVAAIIALWFIAGVVYLHVPWPVPPAANLTVVAHRGVHQSFPLTDLMNETCTAAIIDPPTHAFLENTLPSIAAAFAAGSTRWLLNVAQVILLPRNALSGPCRDVS